MKSRAWLNLVMVILVSGLMLTVSCAKKTVVHDASTIEDQTRQDAEAQARQEAEQRIRQQQLEQQQMAAREQAMKDALVQAKEEFLNQDVLFAYDSSDLDDAAVMALKAKAAWLKANPRTVVTIEGHCDERGTTEYNLALGERRAVAARAYLINLGIASSRLNTISYGEEKPIAMGGAESAYRLNRRAHFVIE